jgi:hypothetical protein
MVRLTMVYMANPGKVFRNNALLGVLIWLAVWVWLRPEWVVCILLFAPLVCVPLGLALLIDQKEPGKDSRIWSALSIAQPFGAAWLIGAFAAPAGMLAGLLTVPWLLVALTVAFVGLKRLALSRLRSTADLSLSAGMIFLVIGAGWTLLSRLGARPLEFSDIIVLLTGVHFHYAGFVLPLSTGLAGQYLGNPTSRLAAVGVVTGVPMVAVGITVGRWVPLIEALAALWMTSACFLVVYMQAQLARRSSWVVVSGLMSLSGILLLAGMMLAAVYAIKSYFGKSWLEVDTMINWHGSINSFGFALPALLGWTLFRSKQVTGKKLD